MSAPRFVRLRCPVCHALSPSCDQTVDIRREGPAKWWEQHRLNHVPYPTWIPYLDANEIVP